jgi:hypothetical protein
MKEFFCCWVEIFDRLFDEVWIWLDFWKGFDKGDLWDWIEIWVLSGSWIEDWIEIWEWIVGFLEWVALNDGRWLWD